MKWIRRLFKRRAKSPPIEVRFLDDATKVPAVNLTSHADIVFPESWRRTGLALAKLDSEKRREDEYGGHTDPRMMSLLDLVRDTDAFPEDMSGDPFDLERGDIVVNERGDVRVILSSDYRGAHGEQEFAWLDIRTGRCGDATADKWIEWAGAHVWHVWCPTGIRWEFRSPFASPFNMEGLSREEPAS